MLNIIDESKNFIFQNTAPNNWNIATICGAILPYKTHKKWLKKYNRIEKGSDFHDEKEVSKIIDGMIDCQIKGVLLIGDIGHASKTDAENYRNNQLITPLYDFADNEPPERCKVLYNHLDNLLSKGTNSFSTQDFYKIWNILEVVVMFLEWFIGNLPKIRSIDIRKLKLIIDDQAKASLITLKEFVYFFLHSRSNEKKFNYPPNSLARLQTYTWEYNGTLFLNAAKLIDSILVEKHGSKMDDKYPELKIADLLSNFSRRALNGDLSYKIAEKLKNIIQKTNCLQAGTTDELFVTVPTKARKAWDLLIGLH